MPHLADVMDVVVPPLFVPGHLLVAAQPREVSAGERTCLVMQRLL